MLMMLGEQRIKRFWAAANFKDIRRADVMQYGRRDCIRHADDPARGMHNSNLTNMHVITVWLRSLCNFLESMSGLHKVVRGHHCHY